MGPVGEAGLLAYTAGAARAAASRFPSTEPGSSKGPTYACHPRNPMAETTMSFFIIC